MPGCRRSWPTAFPSGGSSLLADPQVVDALQRRPTNPADHGVAVAAHQRVRDRPGAVRAVKLVLRFLAHRSLLENGRLGPSLASLSRICVVERTASPST